MAKRVWRRNLNGWRYGIAVSMLILLLTLSLFPILNFLAPNNARFLIIIIDLFAAAEILALVTPGARRFYGT